MILVPVLQRSDWTTLLSDFQTLAMAFRIMRLKKQARGSSRLQEIFQVTQKGTDDEAMGVKLFYILMLISLCQYFDALFAI